MGILDDLDTITNSQDRSVPVKVNGKKRISPVERTLQTSASEISQGYETWSLADLQAEAKKYGFRPTKDRKTIAQQLEKVREALKRKEEAEDADVSMISSSSSFLLPSSPGRSSDVEEVSMGDLTMEILRQAKDTPLSTQASLQHNGRALDGDADQQNEEDESSDDDDGDSGRSEIALAELAAANDSISMNDVAPSVSDQLYRAITSDKSLYHRILLFEPVSFDEVSSTAKRAGVTGLRSKETLRNWLDMQGICFYSADLTGPRHRH